MAPNSVIAQGAVDDMEPSLSDTVASPSMAEEELENDAFREQVERILGCEQFRTSAKISAFLRFVTDAALAGRAHEIKETSIGVAVYGRNPSYDPKLDTVVRTEARRLRQKLDRYFAEEGKNDPIRISLPKGGYVPVFERVVLPSSIEHSEVEDSTPVPSISMTAGDSVDLPGPQVLPRRSRNAILFLGMVALIATATILTIRPFRQNTPASSEYQQILPLTSLPGESYQPDISPDGKSVAFIWNNGTPFFNIYVVQPGGKPLRVTSSNSFDMRPVWSPDASSLAFLRVDRTGTHVMLTAFPGGSERVLFDLHSGRPWGEDQLALRSDAGPNWTPDGRAVIVSDTAPSSRGLGLFKFELASGQLVALTNPSFDQRDLHPVVSPDGKWIAFTRFSSYDSADIFLWSALDRTEKRLTFDRTDLQGLAWNRDSLSVIFSSNRAGVYQLWKINIDGSGMVPVSTSGESAIQPATSRDGKLIVYADASLRSQLLKIPTSSEKPAGIAVSHSTRVSHSAQFSPDGTKIAFVSDRGGSWELWVSDNDGENARQITDFHTSSVGSPRWSPDGKMIVFDARPEGRSSIYVISDSGGAPRRLSSANSEDKQPTWAPDGEWIYFNSNRDGEMHLWKMRKDGSNPVSFSSVSATDPRFTLDGKHLLYTSNLPGLWSLDLDTGAKSQVSGLEDAHFGRLWTVAKNGLYFVNVQSDRRKLMFHDLHSGSNQFVSNLPVDPLVGYPSLTFSADDQSVIFSSKEDVRSDLMEFRLEK